MRADSDLVMYRAAAVRNQPQSNPFHNLLLACLTYYARSNIDSITAEQLSEFLAVTHAPPVHIKPCQAPSLTSDPSQTLLPTTSALKQLYLNLAPVNHPESRFCPSLERPMEHNQSQQIKRASPPGLVLSFSPGQGAGAGMDFS